MTTPAELDWTELDQKAVDTARVLAMDAVQKVGNGHPGTAMSLAPAAYLLFQKVMRHNPADPAWPGRDRFVLSCGHSSITLYTQLFLGGWGLELEDLKSLRTWGSKTPGHPELGHTAGVETTTGPLGQGVANAVGMAMAARRERGLLDPNADEGASPFDHHIYAMCSDGDLEEGVSGEASSIAGTQELGNLTLIYDANRISIEGDTDVAFTEDVAKRYEAYGWHVQTVDWTHDGTEYVEDVPAAVRRDPRRRGGHRPAQLHRAAHGHRLAGPERPGHRRGARLAPSATRRSPPPRRSWASTPSCTSRSPRTSWPTPARWSSAASEEQAAWDEQFAAWTTKPSADPRAASSGSTTRTLPAGWTDALPTFDADPKGVATRKASGEVINALAGVMPELWGGSADLAGVQQHHDQGRAVVPAQGPLDRTSGPATRSPAGCCTSASASTPWARS